MWKIHPNVSKKLLGDQEIRECDFYEITNRYLKEVKSKINEDVSKYIWEAMLELRFHEKYPSQRNGHNIQVSEFQLIKREGEYTDIFVELNWRSTNSLEMVLCEKVHKERDFFKQGHNYFSIRRKFRSYIISVRVNKETILSTEVCGLRYIPQNQLNDFYSMNTGFRMGTDEFFAW